MNVKQTSKGKIYVYSSFKQFCLPVLEFLVLQIVYSSALECCYSNFSDPGVLDFVN